VDVQTAEPTLGDISIVSQSVTNNRCAPSCGGHKGKVGGAHRKIFGLRYAPPPHLQIASDATPMFAICVID